MRISNYFSIYKQDDNIYVSIDNNREAGLRTALTDKELQKLQLVIEDLLSDQP